VPFDVRVDGNVAMLPDRRQSLLVEHDDDAVASFTIEAGSLREEEPWLWILLTQHDRTVQNIELRLRWAAL
jgi:hypothetical protein